MEMKAMLLLLIFQKTCQIHCIRMERYLFSHWKWTGKPYLAGRNVVGGVLQAEDKY